MLTKRQNLLETIRGGKPDRFVKQYEFMNLIMEAPIGAMVGPVKRLKMVGELPLPGRKDN